MRGVLEKLPRLPHHEACEVVTTLDRSHGERRAWVWARLGLAPMAELLKPLASLAASARRVLGGTEPEDIAAAYVEARLASRPRRVAGGGRGAHPR